MNTSSRRTPSIASNEGSSAGAPVDGKKAPVSGLESKFSIYHAASVGLIEGAAGTRVQRSAARNPSVIALRDPFSRRRRSLPQEDQFRVTVSMKDGRRLRSLSNMPSAASNTPMSDSDLEGKFSRLADGSCARPDPPLNRSVLEGGNVEGRCGAGSGRGPPEANTDRPRAAPAAKASPRHVFRACRLAICWSRYLPIALCGALSSPAAHPL